MVDKSDERRLRREARTGADVQHRLGPYLVPPGQTTRIRLAPSGAGSFLCTIHPSRQLLLDVQPRGVELRLTVLPSLLLGPALGTAVALVRRVVRSLDPT